MEQLFNNEAVLNNLHTDSDLATFHKFAKTISDRKKPVLRIGNLEKEEPKKGLICSQKIMAYHVPTESSEETNNQIYEQIKFLEQKDKQLSLPRHISHHNFRETKTPSFVIKHKKSQDLYAEERHQTKTVKNLCKIERLELGPSLHVRKYQTIKQTLQQSP